MHGTSTSNVESILEKSHVRPRLDNIGNWTGTNQNPSIKNMIYLTNKYFHSEFYAARTAVITKSDCAILKFNISNDKLYPDENLFKTHALYSKDDLIKMQKKVLKNKEKWKDSLKRLGLVCHKGKIDNDRIVEIESHKLEDSPYYSFVKNSENVSVEYFDRSFGAYLYLVNDNWFIKCKTKKTLSGLELIQKLNIYHDEDRSTTVCLEDNKVTLQWGLE